MKNPEVFVWHSAKNDVMAKSNMAAVVHDEHLIVLLFIICMCGPNASISTDCYTFNSFLILI